MAKSYLPRRATRKGARVAGPFLKWAGGKGQLEKQILERLPETIDHYFEPFVGGGAIFFALAAQKRFRRAILCDRNPDLVLAYEAVRDEVEEVIRHLRPHRYAEAYYYEVR